jgi:hypothetical protein
VRTSPEWAAFSKALERAYELKARVLLDCSSFEQYREVLGHLRAYEEVLQLNDLVVGKADALDEYRSESAEHSRAQRDAERVALISSRFWSAAGVPVHQ